jgi:hypothetical protein
MPLNLAFRLHITADDLASLEDKVLTRLLIDGEDQLESGVNSLRNELHPRGS